MVAAGVPAVEPIGGRSQGEDQGGGQLKKAGPGAISATNTGTRAIRSRVSLLGRFN